jgi:hypothetical protein
MAMEAFSKMKVTRWLFGGSEFTAPVANIGLMVLRVFAGLALAFLRAWNP